VFYKNVVELTFTLQPPLFNLC